MVDDMRHLQDGEAFLALKPGERYDAWKARDTELTHTLIRLRSKSRTAEMAWNSRNRDPNAVRAALAETRTLLDEADRMMAAYTSDLAELTAKAQPDTKNC